MRWLNWRGINNPTFSILSMIIFIIGSRNQQWQARGLKLFTNICNTISIRSTSINTSFSLEFYFKYSVIRWVHSKAFNIFNWLFQFLNNLSKYCRSSIMITLSTFNKIVSLSSINWQVILISTRQVWNSFSY